MNRKLYISSLINFKLFTKKQKKNIRSTEHRLLDNTATKRNKILKKPIPIKNAHTLFEKKKNKRKYCNSLLKSPLKYSIWGNK